MLFSKQFFTVVIYTVMKIYDLNSFFLGIRTIILIELKLSKLEKRESLIPRVPNTRAPLEIRLMLKK